MHLHTDHTGYHCSLSRAWLSSHVHGVSLWLCFLTLTLRRFGSIF